MQNIAVGQLRVVTDTQVYTFPRPVDELKAELRVVNDAFWVRLCAMGDLGFAEAYMYGDVQCSDLVSLFKIFLANRENLSNLDSLLSYLFTLPQKITQYRFLNTISNSRSNISAHYDISNDMFAGFLSEDMTYSCAIFPELDGDLQDGYDANTNKIKWTGAQTQSVKRVAPKPDDPLYHAQMRKLQHIIDKLHIPPPTPTSPPMRILEIGTGWGALAILLASQHPHVSIDTLTLSPAQLLLAQARILRAGLAGRVRVHLMDYRSMPREWEGEFGRVVSVEMVEAVGGSVFPGGFLPTLTLLTQTLTQGSHGRLVVDSISNIGPHYARTLREWRRRFEARFEEVVVPALRREYALLNADKEMGREEVEVFRRKWIYYYCYCEVGFTTRTLGDHIITFTREGNQEYGCDVFQ
ncbi:CFS1-like protein [Crassisporium funariophilum]|nr:CFS1-like protein [Crassisporium funariophilum]